MDAHGELIDATDALSGKRLALIDSLLQGMGTKEAAASAGVTKVDAEKWMGLAPFRTELLRRRKQSLDVYVTRAIILAQIAQSALTHILSDPNADPELRVKAAIAALNSADRLAANPAVNPDVPVTARPMFSLPPGTKMAILVDTTDVQTVVVPELPPAIETEPVPGDEV